MELGLAGKAALVTGGSRGIGKAIALALGMEGARVCICARGGDGLDAAAEELRRSGVDVSTVVADLRTAEGAQDAVSAAIASAHGLDLLVNNVGGSEGAGPFDQATSEQWESVLDLNLMSAVWCSQRAVEWMKAHGGGAIVNVASLYGREYGRSAPYVAAKGGLIALTKEMGLDLAKYGIRVNSVAPGSILFPGGSWERRFQKDPEGVARMMRYDLPFGRFGTPEEVAAVVAFLCSDKASWVTGACVPVDGGQGKAL